MMRELTRGKGGGDEERARGESEEWREGEHRGAALQILRGRASHNVGPSPLSSPPLPSSTSIALSLRTGLFHFNKANPS